jgi:acyl-CoA thioesterase II
VLAYASDLTLLSATLPVQSLDHVLWFHRACSVNDWLLNDQFVPSTSGGLSLARGRLFSRAGTLVASVMQEGMVRMIDPASPEGARAPRPHSRPSSSMGA